MRIPQPIPYQGSKRRIAATILQHLPLRVSRIVEPFAGSAAISIAAALQNRTKKFWINDAHGPLIDLWREIIEHPESISTEYASLWNLQHNREREFFNEIRHRFNHNHAPADLLYLLARCVKAAVRYNTSGEFNNTPDHRRKGARPLEMEWRITTVSKLFRNRTQLTSDDYKLVLRNCTSSDLIYMDPPYQGVSGKHDSRYFPSFDHNAFYLALAELNERGILFVVSYDGRTGTKTYGQKLPNELGLTRLEVCAGRSTQATLLGKSDITYESLYLSPALANLSQSYDYQQVMQ